MFDTKDLIRYEPGVSVANASTCFGLAGLRCGDARRCSSRTLEPRIEHGVRTRAESHDRSTTELGRSAQRCVVHRLQSDACALGAELVGTAVRRKTSVDTISGPLFIPPSYYTLDVLAHTMLFERLRLNFGVFNLADRKFWEWADVQGRPANDPAIDRYTRTGRHARLGAICRF